MKKISFLILFIILIGVFFSCTSQKTVEELHMRVEIDDTALTQERLFALLEDKTGQRYTLDLAENSSSSANQTYFYLDSETKRMATIELYDSAEEAGQHFDEELLSFCYVGYTVGYRIRINHMIIDGRELSLLDVLSELGVSVPAFREIPNGMNLVRMESKVSLETVMDYLKDQDYEVLDKDDRYGRITVYLPRENGSGFVFTLWPDYSSEYTKDAATYTTQSEYLDYMRELYFEDAFEGGLQGYYTDDYFVVCYAEDWLTILEEAEGYYAQENP